MGTPHNEAEKGEIAKRVLMPGDPLRAKYIAEHFLEDAVCFNTVRNMLGYTGTYKGEKISVMGGGMGVPSVGIYTYELYHEYEVEEIIRIGSAGALQDDVELRDVVIAAGACTDSNYAAQYNLPGTHLRLHSRISDVTHVINRKVNWIVFLARTMRKTMMEQIKPIISLLKNHFQNQ